MKPFSVPLFVGRFAGCFFALFTSAGLAESIALKPGAVGEMRDGLAPGEAVAAFTAYEGFKVTMMAAEPDVRQPVAMTIDHRGRLWVVEAYTYPNRREGDEGEDRILIFEDSDGDGSFDSRKVFTEKLNLVSGLEVGFGGVWVGAAPYLMFIPDRDGDDVPDGPAEVLLDGWGWHDTHETLNSFNWGPDGWLYGCHGVFTHSKVGTPGTPDAERTPINAGVWRYHPVKREFEVFGEGTSNPWGVDFNDHGQAFVTACVIPHLYHIIQGGRYQRQAGHHFDPHTYGDIKTIADHLHYDGKNPWEGSRDGAGSDKGGGHAHCGLSIYLGNQFPPQFRNALLFNNLHGHRINHDVAEPAGSGYVGRHRPDFLFSNDEQHMGVALRYGPDGSLFLIDWYDRQTCHLTLQEVWDRSNGRIYKISYGEVEPVVVDLAKLDDLALVRHQLNPNDWYVRTARRILHERHVEGQEIAPEAVAELRQILGHEDDTRRLRALWALHLIGQLDEAALLEQMDADPSEYVRGWTIQLLNESQASEAAIGRMVALAKRESSPVPRLYLASALQRIPLEKRYPLASALLAHAEDANDHNLPLVLWYGVGPLADVDRVQALDLALGSRIPLVRQFMLRRIAGSPEGREAVIAATLSERADDGFRVAALTGLATAVGDARQLPAPPSWERAAPALEAIADGDGRRAFEKIATVFGDPRMAGRFRAVLNDAAADPADRLAALGNLQRIKDPQLAELLTQKVTAAGDPLRVEFLRALGASGAATAVPTVRELLPSLTGDERQAAILVLTTTPEGATLLARALAAGELPRADVSAFAARQMRNFGDETINQILAEHWGMIGEGGADKAAEVVRLEALLTPEALSDADLRRGRELYRATCHACHGLFGDGAKLGPDLTGSNRTDIHYLLENLLDPGAVVGIDYQLHVVQTKDGRTIAGMLRSKTENALTLAMVGETEVIVGLDEIEDHQVSPVSLMPEGLLGNLSEEDIRNLIAYLRSPAQVPLPSPHEVLIDDQALNVVKVNGGGAIPQGMSGFAGGKWTSDSQIWWTGGKPNDTLVLHFEAPAAGNYEIYTALTLAPDYGIVRLRLNGEPAGEYDLFQKNGVARTPEILIGSQTLSAGVQNLEVEILGLHPESKGTMFGIDHIRLIPME
jgi:putative membrane-bound dehydrogenase-like protein